METKANMFDDIIIFIVIATIQVFHGYAVQVLETGFIPGFIGIYNFSLGIFTFHRRRTLTHPHKLAKVKEPPGV
jgi:hypothetical protein